MTPRGARLAALAMALVLGQFLYLQVRSTWANYWLLTDAQKGTALVTMEWWSGHGAVGYDYVVAGKRYSGHSSRDWKDPKRVPVGGTTTVYYSASHPWISLLYMPRALLEGLPVIMMVLVFETFSVITIINPTGRWALTLAKKEHKDDP